MYVKESLDRPVGTRFISYHRSLYSFSYFYIKLVAIIAIGQTFTTGCVVFETNSFLKVVLIRSECTMVINTNGICNFALVIVAGFGFSCSRVR